MDVYGKFGLLVLIPLLLFFARYYVYVLFTFIKRKSLVAFALLLPFSFYIVHASVAGHAFTIAQTNNLMMLIYYLSFCEAKTYRKKRRMRVAIASGAKSASSALYVA